MHNNLASRLLNIAPFHVMELAKMAAELEKEGRNIIHMGIGEPDFTAPQVVIDAAARAMQNGNLQYTSALGLPDLRLAISKYYLEYYQLTIPASRIIVTAGASAALLLTCAALVDPGSEVLMPDPCYPCNRHFVAAFEGVARLVECGPEVGFQLTDELVREHWTTASKGVLLASPSNPTGTSIPRAELAKIIATVKAKQGFTIVDEIYQGLSYDDEAFSALSLDGDVLVINSFSKFFNMTGWRLGWLVVPERIVPQIEKLAQNLFICPSTVAQYAALACFSNEAMKIYQQRKAEFKRRRDFIVPALRKLGFKVPVTPDGAFYVYADCSGFSDNADLFTRDLLQKAGVVIVPGLDFGSYTARKYVRISYATSMENLQEAVLRIENYLRQQ
ncbi:pyridoxal phosphate-dependent aminotransferase [Undibacterium parvum]|uniref:Aminotransferase n=1 Tax=Undibacterium parvum TaxID=401471 RepID=A0A3S9HPC0_9BURK|nr:pyridoxal phosphate-dependent aminotransferase [Undibacterium parvum]AZP13968.1 pyridoxal phosphate-dependent aminotransferase [Undibacterium parvum]